MLSGIHFQNIGALADFSLDALTPLTVLVGPNACGKSTVLDEVQRLCEMSHPPLSRGTAHPTEAGSGFVLIESGFPMVTSGSSKEMMWAGRWKDRSLCVTIDAKEQEWMQNIKLVAKNEEFSEFYESIIGEIAPHGLDTFLEKIATRAQRLSLERRMLLRPSPPNAPLDMLDRAGSGIATLLLHLAANETEAYLVIQQDLALVIPDFRRLHVAQNSQADDTFYTMEMTFGGAGRIPARHASEGALLALGVLTAIHAPTMPSVVLLDDLDRGLHPSAQRRLIQAIRAVQERQPHLQVICTSHSPVLVDSFRPDEVRVMTLDERGHAQAKTLTEIPDFPKWSRAMQSGELWASFGEAWATPQAPEGP